MALLSDWDEAGAVESPAVGVGELVALEDPAAAQPGSNASVTAASNHLTAPEFAESRMLHLPLLDVRSNPAHKLDTEVQCDGAEPPMHAQPSCSRPTTPGVQRSQP